jgi:hypothetical protein
MGHVVSYPVVAEFLHEMGYSLQSKATATRTETRSLSTSTPKCSSLSVSSNL